MSRIQHILADVSRAARTPDLITDARSLSLAIDVAACRHGTAAKPFLMSQVGNHDVSGEARGSDGKWTSGGKTLSTVHEKLAALLAEHPEHAEHIQKAIAGVQGKPKPAAKAKAPPAKASKPEVDYDAHRSEGWQAQPGFHKSRAQAEAAGEAVAKYPDTNMWVSLEKPAAKAGLLSLPIRDFASQVQEAANAYPHGFHGNKVFISDMYEHLKAQNPGITEPEFKSKLVEANREGHLNLSRANEVAMMHPDDVKKSETNQGDHSFHFILTPENESRTNRHLEAQIAAAHGGKSKLLTLPAKDFSTIAQNAADRVPHSPFGGDTDVYISDVFDELKKQYPSLTLDSFKDKLQESSRAGHVELGRADTPTSYHPGDLARSVTTAGGAATFHVMRSRHSKRAEKHSDQELKDAWANRPRPSYTP